MYVVLMWEVCTISNVPVETVYWVDGDWQNFAVIGQKHHFVQTYIKIDDVIMKVYLYHY